MFNSYYLMDCNGKGTNCTPFSLALILYHACTLLQHFEGTLIQACIR